MDKKLIEDNLALLDQLVEPLEGVIRVIKAVAWASRRALDSKPPMDEAEVSADTQGGNALGEEE